MSALEISETDCENVLNDRMIDSMKVAQECLGGRICGITSHEGGGSVLLDQVYLNFNLGDHHFRHFLFYVERPSYFSLALSVQRAVRWITAKSCHSKFATDLEGKCLHHDHELCVKGNKLSGELSGFSTKVFSFRPRCLRSRDSSRWCLISEINQIQLSISARLVMDEEGALN
jgi:hypothetical protein